MSVSGGGTEQFKADSELGVLHPRNLHPGEAEAGGSGSAWAT